MPLPSSPPVGLRSAPALSPGSPDAPASGRARLRPVTRSQANEMPHRLLGQALRQRAIALGWQTTGRTPEATLYSAITREIAAKGEASRFVKSGKGLFTAGKA